LVRRSPRIFESPDKNSSAGKSWVFMGTSYCNGDESLSFSIVRWRERNEEFAIKRQVGNIWECH
jgi:hypothetical protein